MYFCDNIWLDENETKLIKQSVFGHLSFSNKLGIPTCYDIFTVYMPEVISAAFKSLIAFFFLSFFLSFCFHSKLSALYKIVI